MQPNWNLLPVYVLLMLQSCLEPLAPDVMDCEESNLYVSIESVSATSCGLPAGEILATAYGGYGQRYFSINGSLPQTSGQFSGLRPGEYLITVTDSAACAATARALIRSGISYRNTVKSIIETNCTNTGCHDGTTGAIDFRIFKNVQEKAADIKGRTGTRNMPKVGRLTDEEIEQIACWVDDGAMDN